MERLFIFGITFCVISWAHPLDLGLARAAVQEESVDAEMRLHEEMAAGMLGVPADELSELLLASKASELRESALGVLSSEKGPCPWGNAGATRDGNAVVVRARAACPKEGGRYHWEFRVLRHPGAASTFRVLATVRSGASER